MKKKSIGNFYLKIEKINTVNIWEISHLIPSINVIDKNELWKIIAERKVLTFQLNNGELINNIINTDSEGKIINLNLFNDKEIEYLKSRLKITNNNWLKTKYSHILWNLTRNNKYSAIAIENYITIIKHYKIGENVDLISLIDAILFLSYKTMY